MNKWIKCNIKGYEGIWKLNKASKRLFSSEVQYLSNDHNKILKLDPIKYLRYLNEGRIEEL